MDILEVPVQNHSLLPFNRFVYGECKGCELTGYIYGGYRCNELGCGDVVFHKKCRESLPEIKHSVNPDGSLKLFSDDKYTCGSRRSVPLRTLTIPRAHEHSLELFDDTMFDRAMSTRICKVCGILGYYNRFKYECARCKLLFSLQCVTFLPEAYHTTHPKHKLKFFTCEAAPSYADKKCILCREELDDRLHCDICNFSICSSCMKNPPPLVVTSLTTHEHQLHLVPRLIEFTCDSCGTTGDRSPYFCLPCNYMIHRECIDLPRVININRHDHRISYTPRLGHGEWKCSVCREKVDGFYGAYSCSKCPTFAVHARCATRRDVWDMVELEGTPEEEEETAPFEVVDDNTIKHFSHDHNLRINKDGEVLHESILCGACAFQICSEPFYSCEQCSFILHAKCANLPRKKRHVCDNLPFILQTDDVTSICQLCCQIFNGFRYANRSKCIDVRCGSFSEPFGHGSHPHPLYYSADHSTRCSQCRMIAELTCDECDFRLCFKCGVLPQKVMRHRYDDHPLSLSYGEDSVDGEYWCEACETKLNPEKWFYSCNDCGVVLHISCTVGDFTYFMPGPCYLFRNNGEVVPNTSIPRALCARCSMRCILPSIFKASRNGVAKYFCSLKCSSWIPVMLKPSHML